MTSPFEYRLIVKSKGREATEKQELRDYLQKKDEFYTKIRRIRKKDNSN